jgi:hypothetical protein
MDLGGNSLEKVCRKNGLCFQSNLLGNVYCRLSMDGRKIECPYLEEKDKNGVYSCKAKKQEILFQTLK